MSSEDGDRLQRQYPQRNLDDLRPQPLGKDVVHHAPSAIHADVDTFVFQAIRLTRSDPLDRLKPSMWRPSEKCCWCVPASVAATRPRIAGWLTGGSRRSRTNTLSVTVLTATPGILDLKQFDEWHGVR